MPQAKLCVGNVYVNTVFCVAYFRLLISDLVFKVEDSSSKLNSGLYVCLILSSLRREMYFF